MKSKARRWISNSSSNPPIAADCKVILAYKKKHTDGNLKRVF